MTPADPDAVKADAEDYPDGDRPRTRSAGDAMLAHDINKDVALLAQGRVKGLEWHFFPSSASGTLGPSRELLDELRKRGIDYIIHLP